MAIGNPFGLGGSVTVGVISATRRDINAGLYDEFLQTDAAINRGNSGGPLFNMDGEVIGVNTAIISPTGGSIGIGFAVPSSTVSQVIGQLKTYGETRRGWLGVRIQTVNDEIAESLGLKKVSGALVAAITPEGPAAAAGIEVGDVILKFDGRDIGVMRQLPKLVAQAAIGKEVEIVVLRKGERKTLKATIERMEESLPKAPEEEKKKPKKRRKRSSLGLSLAALSPDLRSRYDIDSDVNGVVITDIEPESPVMDKEVRTGNVIIEVTHKKVRSPEELAARLDELRKLKRKSALLMLSDGHGELNFVAVSLDEEE
jgi:serine protease Do